MELKERIKLLRRAEGDLRFQQILLEKSRRDIHFWFNTFCWTFDPRADKSNIPFILYPFQEWGVSEIHDCIASQQDLLIDKSRDMGVSWMVLLVFQYWWLFSDGANFHVGSRKLDFVDKLGDISTLMEKFRYNIRRLPRWMRPAGYDAKHDSYTRIINPANGNILTGESANHEFARGGRYRAVLFDEFPFWPFDDPAFASAAQSTNCRILVGTPYGMTNRFARESHDSKTIIIKRAL